MHNQARQNTKHRNQKHLAGVQQPHVYTALRMSLILPQKPLCKRLWIMRNQAHQNIKLKNINVRINTTSTYKHTH